MAVLSQEQLAAAKAVVIDTQYAGVFHVQRRLRVTYRQAVLALELLEAAGVVGPDRGDEPRQVLARPE